MKPNDAKKMITFLERDLDVLEGTEDFDARCRAAAQAAWEVRLMRSVAAEKLEPCGFLEHARDLAKQAGADIERVFDWFGIGQLVTNAEMFGAVRLGKALGLDARAISVLVPWEIADRQGVLVGNAAQLPAGLAAKMDPLAACEAELREVNWTPKSRALLEAFGEAVREEYGDE